MNAKQYAAQCRKLAGAMDANRWALAKLAAMAKADGLDAWAEIAGEECGRSSKTIYEWVSVLDFQNSLPRKRLLRFSHVAALSRVSDRLPEATILDLFDHAVENNISVESLREMINDELEGDDIDPIRDAHHKLGRVRFVLNSIGRMAGLPSLFYHAINAALEALAQLDAAAVTVEKVTA